MPRLGVSLSTTGGASTTQERAVEYIHLKDFDHSACDLRRAGGERKREHDKVLQILGGLGMGSDPLKDLPTTNNGESRIRGCVKYDLGGGYRLVTVQTKNFVALCYVGSHDDVDRWLEANSGLTLSKGRNGDWEPMFQSHSVDQPLRRMPTQSSEHLLGRIDRDRVDRMLEGIPASIIARLAALGTLVTPQEIEVVCAGIVPDCRRMLGSDVFALLAGRNAQAR